MSRPYTRGEFNRALVLNALLRPFNVLLLAAMLAAGIVLDVLLPLLPVALVVYGIAATRTYFDEDQANKVLERERAERKEVERPALDRESLAEPIRELLEVAHHREARIREAIERADLPYQEVSAEVDRFVRDMDFAAARAQLLHDALSETPPAWVEQRLQQVSGDREKAELATALEHQLAVLRRMEGQLRGFYTGMERMLVELETVRANLVSVSASTEAANQTRLAGDVRGLREELSAVADGMREAYEEPSPS
jgi:chromosome segregation ATPase